MKSLFFSLFLLTVVSFNAFSQKMEAQLRSKKWYANGAIGSGAITLRTTQGTHTADQWEAKFSSTGYLYNCATTTKDVVDATGDHVKAGTFYCDSFNVYHVKNDMISILKMDKTFYYRIKALPNSEGIELSPATKEDFK